MCSNRLAANSESTGLALYSLHMFVIFEPPRLRKQDYRGCTSMPFGVRSIEVNCHIFAFRN